MNCEWTERRPDDWSGSSANCSGRKTLHLKYANLRTLAAGTLRNERMGGDAVKGPPVWNSLSIGKSSASKNDEGGNSKSMCFEWRTGWTPIRTGARGERSSGVQNEDRKGYTLHRCDSHLVEEDAEQDSVAELLVLQRQVDSSGQTPVLLLDHRRETQRDITVIKQMNQKLLGLHHTAVLQRGVMVNQKMSGLRVIS